MRCNFDVFIESLTTLNSPVNLDNVYLQALWHDYKGNWKKSHDLIEHLSGSTAAHIHAYLHRKEGDEWNAAYWYRKAGVPFPEITLDQEWESLVKRLL